MEEEIVIWKWISTHFEGVVLLPIHDIQNESGENIKSLAVSDLFIPSSVRQQDSLQNSSIFFIVLAIKTTAACSVQILKWTKVRVQIKSRPNNFNMGSHKLCSAWKSFNSFLIPSVLQICDMCTRILTWIVNIVWYLTIMLIVLSQDIATCVTSMTPGNCYAYRAVCKSSVLSIAVKIEGFGAK